MISPDFIYLCGSPVKFGVIMLVLKIAELQKRVSYNKLSLETMLNIDSGEGRVDLIYTVEVE